MAVAVNVLPGLPPYGPMATPFPLEWARAGREGFVVEFHVDGESWVGNFRPGNWGIDLAASHPNGRDAVVIAKGDLWIVDPGWRTADELLSAIDVAIDVSEPAGWILSRQGVALARLGSRGFLWHTRRLSWDGFKQLEYSGGVVRGLACFPGEEQWVPFEVDAQTGRSTGGSYDGPDIRGWERLAE